MKKSRLLSIIAALILAPSFFLSSCSNGKNAEVFLSPHSPFAEAAAVSKTGAVSEEVRGVWIASVYNINFPSAPDLSEDQLKAELEDIVQTVLSKNMNTVYFQVHPASDALYKSTLFPVSKYLYTDGVLKFDPLEYMLSLCRENGISLYAWVNPLRVSVSAADSKDAAKAALPENSPGRDDGLTVFYGDGKLYLNCGAEDVRSLAAAAVDEIMSEYDVDGIVFDDYFYPYPASDSSGGICIFDDGNEYAASGSTLSLEDWRRENVNQLIKLCYDTVKSHGENKKFGVAPFGIWKNDDGSTGGSATSGMEAYSALYCDASAWIAGGYVDFISPQLYWECDNTTAPFGELANFWNSLTDGTGVDLIISHGLYRYGGEWENPEGEITAQIGLSRELISYKGSILYGYSALKENTSGAADDVDVCFSGEVYYYTPQSYPEGVMVSVDGKTDGDDLHVTFSGYSDPKNPLTVNGIQISRGPGGYFQCELSLEYGENNFDFVCGDAAKTVTVIKNSPEKAD